MVRWNELIPKDVVKKLTTLDVEGIKWKDNLNALIKGIEKEWNISLDRVIEGGSEAFVARCTLSNGTKCIVKIFIPQLSGNSVFVQQVEAYKVANGYGYAKLFKYDIERKVMLLECLGLSMCELTYSTQEQIKIICSLLKETWITIDENYCLKPMRELIQWFREFIIDTWEKTGKPCDRKVIDRAMLYLKSREMAINSYERVLIHGDPHSGNILQTLNDDTVSFKFIDPDGIIGEPGYDLGVLMREWINEFEDFPIEKAKERISLLYKETGIDIQSIWEWGFIQLVSTGLFLILIEGPGLGDRMLTISSAWLSIQSMKQ
ncbi:aminoglycoside phosphotransferase family protein [Aerococcaceae bacterium NML210727]|nr:aminoglycoside phosphotransferase family protein [Aerococcaceae bacterium NML210727]MCW6654127.1 aminoglycoside phosphotransferase family protein [Aerococcaceae bacterium NML201296]MCW6661826.1 aminoglycoside phosphotransferase family protein [Aerococcaceae bacterium NML201209]MCW6666401.1 aminoglycoside phosphotransferase family protein [Aerococcaceae bacterium NML190938]MCW6677001.1 aminoglycoside phosphotransferase family protein [Aerococcaceae bacterium NML180378]